MRHIVQDSAPFKQHRPASPDDKLMNLYFDGFIPSVVGGVANYAQWRWWPGMPNLPPHEFSIAQQKGTYTGRILNTTIILDELTICLLPFPTPITIRVRHYAENYAMIHSESLTDVLSTAGQDVSINLRPYVMGLSKGRTALLIDYLDTSTKNPIKIATNLTQSIALMASLTSLT